MRCPHPNRWKCTQVAPTELKTIGDHLKSHRIKLHLMQPDVANLIGVHFASIQNWERGVYEPIPKFYSAIIRFLGYVPFNHDGTVGGRVAYLRLCAGLTQEEFADILGCTVTTIWRMESNRSHSAKRSDHALAILNRRIDDLGLRLILEPKSAGARYSAIQ